MIDLSFSIVIATYNRSKLLIRALNSVYSQTILPQEIIVVDDFSTDDTFELFSNSTKVRYFRQENNQGVGSARNLGLRMATSKWVLILDDDDELFPNALETVKAKITEFANSNETPVVQFPRGNATLTGEFREISLSDYFNRQIKGDFIPIIQTKLFLSLGFSYPTDRVGSEHLLWWKLADQFSIPTWSTCIGTVGTDAPIRLTSVNNQLSRPSEYALLQEITLSEFGEKLSRMAPNVEREKRLGAALYRMLAGDRSIARQHAINSLHQKVIVEPIIILLLSFLPISLTKWCFIQYRKRQGITQ
jgi:glycosyltransferase involved in cell wall biosynthesis